MGYPRRALALTLALAALIAGGSLALSGVPAPAAISAALPVGETSCTPAPYPESMACADGVDNDCDGGVDCADAACGYDAACGGCPWWDVGCAIARAER